MVLPALRCLVISVCCFLAVAAGVPAHAQDLDADLGALLAAPQSAELDLIERVAQTREPRAAAGLVEAYGKGATPYVQRAILRALPTFDEVPGASMDALGLLTDIAVGESMLELREAALDGLAICTQNGRAFLAMIVDSPADDDVRVKALEAHIAMGKDEDHAWYKRLYLHGLGSEEQAGTPPRSKAKPNKGDPPAPLEAQPLEALRPLAFQAIAGDLELGELHTAAEDPSSSIRVRTLEELYLRGDSKLDARCRDIFDNRTESTANRALAAKLAFEMIGPRYAKDLIKEAVRGITPGDLRDKLAGLLAASDDDSVKKLVAKGFGKGKAPEKLFYLVAARGHYDPKFEKALVGMFGDKEPEVARAAADYAIAEGVESAGPAIEELFAAAESSVQKAELLPGLARFQTDSKGWRGRLEVLAKAPEADLRNMALTLLADLGKEELPTLVAALDHEAWTTRLTALHALEVLREPKSVGEIIARFDAQDGRMRVEFAETLFRMTGQSFGPRPAPWRAWWDKEGSAGFELPSAAELRLAKERLEVARLKEVTGARFFGIRIESERVAFIIDVSGSMDELTRTRYVNTKGMPRIVRAKEELLACLDALNPKSFFNIIPFSGGAYSWRPRLVQWCPETLVEAREFVNKLGTGGGTNLIESLFMALDDPEIDTVFVLSDGEPSAGPITDPSAIRAAVRSINANRRLVFHSVAIGGSLNVLKWLAEDSGGTYRSFP